MANDNICLFSSLPLTYSETLSKSLNLKDHQAFYP